MIVDTLAQAELYRALNPRFAPAFDFLRRPDLERLAEGRHELAGDDLYATVYAGPARTRGEGRLEIHRRYVDIQFLLAGKEEIGWRDLDGCGMSETPYDAAKDLRFLPESPTSWITLIPGMFAIFFPSDAHLPLVGTAPLRKIVVKVRNG